RGTGEPIRAMASRSNLASGVQAWNPRSGSVGVDAHATHHVVARRADLHRLGGDVDVGQLFELVVHRRQPLADVVGWTATGDVQEHPAVWRATAGLDFGVYCPRDLIAG